MLDDYSIYSVIIFSVMVLTCLIIDLHANKAGQVISAKQAGMWTALWVSLAFAFSIYVWVTHGFEDFSLFIAGYLLEESLSIDNMFMIMAVFTSFGIRDEFQHRVLYYGIMGAMVLRLLFVALGSTFLAAFGTTALVIFGVFVLWSAYKMWQATNSEAAEIEDYTDHWSVKLTRKFIRVHPHLEKEKFFVKEADGKWAATPLFLCLIVIEFADVMFAFDSVPAILAITQKPFLVYTSNIFAILGLRSMYFLLAAAKRYLIHLEKAVICILVYIGIKMLIQASTGWHMPAMLSLSVVIVFLSGGVAASLYFKKPDEEHKKEVQSATPDGVLADVAALENAGLEDGVEKAKDGIVVEHNAADGSEK